MARALTSKLLAPADPLAVTTFTDSVTLPAVVFVAVALSITALQLMAVYCVVCVFSACLAATNTLDVTVIFYPLPSWYISGRAVIIYRYPLCRITCGWSIGHSSCGCT
jgi:hypothetical protein